MFFIFFLLKRERDTKLMNRAKNNNNNNYCSFCISIGLKGPFDHNLKLGNNIICPLLLNTTCSLCGEKRAH